MANPSRPLPPKPSLPFTFKWIKVYQNGSTLETPRLQNVHVKLISGMRNVESATSLPLPLSGKGWPLPLSQRQCFPFCNSFNMASARKKQDEKHLKILRDLVSNPPNRQCFDCHQRGPTYVNMTIGSYVCTSCSGLL